MKYYCDIFYAKPRHYWSRIRASNGKVLWHSETYKAKQNAVKPMRKLVSDIGKTKCKVVFYNRVDKTKEVL